MDLLTVRNTHASKPLVLRHDISGPTVIQPGKDRIVPLNVAVVNFGNPGAVNDGRNQNRDAEVKHVYTWWGFYPGMMSDDAWLGVGIEAGTSPPKQIGPLCPPAECYDLDGNRVWMIHDDPAGDHRDSATSASINQSFDKNTTDGMQAQIDQLSRQLRDVLAAQNGTTPAPPPEDDGPDVGAMLAGAMEQVQSQAERNAQRDEIPQPPADESVAKDKPRTTRSGSRAAG